MTMQPVVATMVLKIGSTGLHCDGCMNRIRSKTLQDQRYTSLALVMRGQKEFGSVHYACMICQPWRRGY